MLISKMKKVEKRILDWLIPLIALTLILLHSFLEPVQSISYILDVNRIRSIDFLESHYTYIYMHLFALVPVLSLSFDKKVAYYKKWEHLFPALLIVAIIFWIWDIWKTAVGVWGFNPTYYTFKFINLPIEEWLFFFTFPWASIFIYECLNAYFPKNTFLKNIDTPLSIGLIITLLAVALSHWQQTYTFVTFLLAGCLVLWHFIRGDKKLRSNFYRAYIVGLIPFVLVNGVLTGGFTQEPVVFYNPNEYLGLRFITIPFDDFAYNLILLFSVLLFYDHFKNR